MDREERFRKLLRELGDKTVIVEGRRDVLALKSLNVINTIPINGKPLSAVAHTLHEKGVTEVVILTDYDREGKELYRKLKMHLERYRLFVDSSLRHKLRKYGKGKIEDFAYIEQDFKNKGDMHGKTFADVDKVRHTRHDKGKRHNREP